ncbi:MAG: glycosyltransferase family 4 protein [Planctomycetota bacterium]|nr:glycosyltransferase family 4 protein [Planctomycetota bacterium]
MKVALIRREFSLSKGGAEGYSVALARSLAQLGCEVHLFAEKFGISEQIPVFHHKVQNIKYRTFLKHLVFVRNARKALQNERFDSIVALARVDCADVYRSGDPLFIHWLKCHKPTITDRIFGFVNPKQRSLLALEERIFQSARIKKIVALSQMDKRLMTHYYNVPEKKVVVLHNGVDTERFNPSVKRFRKEVRKKHSIPEDAPLVLFVGMDFKRKNLGILIDSFAHLPSEFTLLVIGAGKQRQVDENLKKLKLENRIFFTGRVSDIERYYGAADVFALPSLYDPFCNAVLEATACGVSVVVSENAGASELIEHGENGLILKSDSSAKELSDNIIKAYEQQERFGTAAAKTAESHTLKSYAASFLSLLKTL